MKSLLLDSSSAILLFRTDLLPRFLPHYTARIGPTVRSELTGRHRAGSPVFRQWCENGTLQLCASVAPALPSPFVHLDPGEAETLLLLQKGHADFAVVDDRRAARACYATGLPFINALLVPRVLETAGILQPDAAAAYFLELTRIGRYAGWVVTTAREMGRTGLERFLPASGRPAQDNAASQR